MKKTFNTEKIPGTTKVFSQAVITDKLIFLSGTAGIDPATGKVISDNFEDQVRQAFLNIKTILEEAGSDLSKVIKTTVFMVAGNEFSTLNKVYEEIFPTNPPARSAPQVMPFPGGLLVSVECIAHS